MKRASGVTSGLPGQFKLLPLHAAGIFEEIGIDPVGQPRAPIGRRPARMGCAGRPARGASGRVPPEEKATARRSCAAGITAARGRRSSLASVLSRLVRGRALRHARDSAIAKRHRHAQPLRSRASYGCGPHGQDGCAVASCPDDVSVRTAAMTALPGVFPEAPIPRRQRFSAPGSAMRSAREE